MEATQYLSDLMKDVNEVFNNGELSGDQFRTECRNALLQINKDNPSLTDKSVAESCELRARGLFNMEIWSLLRDHVKRVRPSDSFAQIESLTGQLATRIIQEVYFCISHKNPHLFQQCVSVVEVSDALLVSPIRKKDYLLLIQLYIEYVFLKRVYEPIFHIDHTPCRTSWWLDRKLMLAVEDLSVHEWKALIE